MPRQVVQRQLFGEPHLSDVINVAKVEKLSPFRYPGGKTWFVPRIRQWLLSKPVFPAEFLEPFAGGGIISLTVAAESLAAHIVMVELDADVAAVWKTIFEGDADWLADEVLRFDLTPSNLEKTLKAEASSIQQVAFKTILKNRTFHGGILAAGSAPLRYGESGKGIKSRWYPETLSRRIRTAACFRDRMEFIHGNAFEIIKKWSLDPDTAFFIDPPYTAGGKRAGSRLYNHWELDHEKLFSLVSKLRGDFLMTYDSSPEIRSLAIKYGLPFKEVAMKNTHHSVMSELLIGKNLDWVKTTEG